MKKYIAASTLALLALAMAACNTVEGAGQDIKASGKAIEREADEHKDY